MLQISVIVPTYDDDERLQKCITALAEQSLDSRFYEVIIVNNSNNSVTCRLPETGFKLLQELKPGSYAARNKGLEAAKGEYIAFTDSDCIPDREWLKAGLNRLMNGCAERVAGRVVVFPQSARMNAIECYETICAFNQIKNVENGTSVTANLFVTRSVFSQVGNFRDSLLSGGDTEWSIRASNAGISLEFSSAAKIFHPARSSWAEISKKIDRTMEGKLMIDPEYNLSVVSSIAPPLSAMKTIASSKGTLRAKIVAFFVAYLVKVKTLRSFCRIKYGKSKPQRS